MFWNRISENQPGATEPEILEYSGSSHPTIPIALHAEGKRYEIEQIERSWIETDEERIRTREVWVVRTSKGRFRISYSLTEEHWEAIEFLGSI
ncbi:MAG: hypothetical protein PHP64_03370 [Actinomycetota bacterium]|nr:hypothetical protein [Actinomycetota bacterium]